MERGAWSPARWLCVNVLLVCLALTIAITQRAEYAIPAARLGENDSPAQPRFSLVSAVVSRVTPLALMKQGFPLMRYVEESRADRVRVSPTWSVVSWLLGMEVKGPLDLLSAELGAGASGPGYVPAYDLTVDWDSVPVLITLPAGGEARPVTVPNTARPVVAVYHTHATESFLPLVGAHSPEEAFSSDASRNMVRVGEILVAELRRLGIGVVHSRTVHDAAGRIGAYARSEITVVKIKEAYPEISVFIDLHRDSQRAELTTAVIRGKRYARIMAVVATENPSWMANYSFARELLDALDRRYPGLSRGIFYESAVYNQKYSPMAVLIEVGGVDNTLEECEASMKALALALREVLVARAILR